MGDPQERLFAGALKLIETGNCPNANLLPKSLDVLDTVTQRQGRLSRALWPAWQGIEQLTGFQ